MSLCPQRGHHLYIHLWLSCLSARAHTHTHPSLNMLHQHGDMTTPEPKHIEGHSEIAPGNTRWSRFPLWSPFIPLFSYRKPRTSPSLAHRTPSSVCKDRFYYCVVRLSMCWTGGPCTGRLEGISARMLSHFVAAPAAPPPL